MNDENRVKRDDESQTAYTLRLLREDQAAPFLAAIDEVRAERDAAIGELDRAMETRENANACTLRVEAERDALRAQLGPIIEALLPDWQQRESMPAEECVRLILAERDASCAENARLVARACGWEETANRLATGCEAARLDLRTVEDILTEAAQAWDAHGDALLEAIETFRRALDDEGGASTDALYATANEIAAKRGKR